MELIFSFFEAILSLLIIQLCGAFLILGNFEDESTFFVNFKIHLIGFTSVVFTTALICTNLNTSLLGIIFPLFFILHKRNKSTNDFKGLLNKIYMLIRRQGSSYFTLLIFFFLQIIFRWNGNEISKIFYSDIDVYSEFIFELKKGNENTLGILNDVYFDSNIIRTPYHYIELWFSVFVSFLFNDNKLNIIFIQVVSPILAAITVIGIKVLIVDYLPKLKGKIIILLSIMLLFVGPMANHFNKWFLDKLTTWFNNYTVILENPSHLNHFLLTKNYPFYLLTILFFLYIKRNKHTLALVIISISIAINIGLVPGVFSIVFFMTIYWKILGKIGTVELLQVYIVLGCLLIFQIGYLGLFQFKSTYWITKFEIDEGIGVFYRFLEKYSIKGELVRIFFRFIGPCLWLSILYFAFLFLLMYLNFKTRKRILFNKERVWLVVFIFAGALVTRIFLQGTNSPQFISFIIPFLNVLLIIWLINEYDKNGMVIFFFLLIVTLLNFKEFSVYTKNSKLLPSNHSVITSKDLCFERKVLNALSNRLETRIGWIMSDQQLELSPPNIWFLNRPTSFLSAEGFYNIVNLNNPYCSYPINTLNIEPTHFNHLKYYYHPNQNYRNKLKEFINKKNVKFIIFNDHCTFNQYKYLGLKEIVRNKINGDVFSQVIPG
jgi:hypothetical protein